MFSIIFFVVLINLSLFIVVMYTRSELSDLEHKMSLITKALIILLNKYEKKSKRR